MDRCRDRLSNGAVSEGPVRRVNRLRLHVGLTVGAVVALVLGEVLGNVLFRGATIRVADLGDEVLLGVLLGNVLAVWFWYSSARR